MEQNREALLQNLKWIRNEIIGINQISAQLVTLEGEYRGYQANISTDKVQDKVGLLLKALIRALVVVYFAMAVVLIILGEVGSAIGVGFGGAVLLEMYLKYIKGNQKLNTSKKIVYGLVVAACALSAMGFSLAIILVAGIIATVEWFVIIPKKNQEIDATNEMVKQHNANIREQANGLKGQLQEKSNELLAFASDWYPRDYYTYHASDFFVSALENRKADTMKELVNLYDRTQEYKKMVEFQKQQEQRMEQLVNAAQQAHYDRQAIEKQFIFSNVLDVYNTCRRWC